MVITNSGIVQIFTKIIQSFKVLTKGFNGFIIEIPIIIANATFDVYE